jgi:hypothetical protein
VSAADQRRTAWRVLEFAARIAQEDEATANHLLAVASSAFRKADLRDGYINDMRDALFGYLDSFSSALREKLDAEERMKAFNRDDNS